MAWSDASQRLEEMPDARPGCDSSIPNSSSISTPTAAACRCRYQSLTAGGMIKTTSELIGMCVASVTGQVVAFARGRRRALSFCLHGAPLVTFPAPRAASALASEHRHGRLLLL